MSKDSSAKIVSLGKTIEETQANLREAVELFLESFGAEDAPETIGEVILYPLEVAVGWLLLIRLFQPTPRYRVGGSRTHRLPTRYCAKLSQPGKHEVAKLPAISGNQAN